LAISFFFVFVENKKVKKLLLSIFFIFPLVGHAIDFESPEYFVGAKSDITVMEALELANPDNSSKEESRPVDPEQESNEPDSYVLSQKLVEGVGDPARIDAFEKGLYVEEDLLEGDFEKRTGEETEKEKKQKENDRWFGNASKSDVLSIPDPLAENDSFFSESPFDEEAKETWGDESSFEEIPL
jgi:hypothetical protein